MHDKYRKKQEQQKGSVDAIANSQGNVLSLYGINWKKYLHVHHVKALRQINWLWEIYEFDLIHWTFYLAIQVSLTTFYNKLSYVCLWNKFRNIFTHKSFEGTIQFWDLLRVSPWVVSFLCAASLLFFCTWKSNFQTGKVHADGNSEFSGAKRRGWDSRRVWLVLQKGIYT